MYKKMRGWKSKLFVHLDAKILCFKSQLVKIDLINLEMFGIFDH